MVSLSRSFSSSSMISPWKSGCSKPNTINWTGPIAIAYLLVDFGWRRSACTGENAVTDTVAPFHPGEARTRRRHLADSDRESLRHGEVGATLLEQGVTRTGARSRR